MSNKECKGLRAAIGLAYKDQWACADEYPDHEMPIELFGNNKTNPDGKQKSCRKCRKYYYNIHNPEKDPKRRRHPETNQRRMNWLDVRAIEYYGGEPEDRKTDKHWKECRAKATKDAESIAWVRPDDSQPSNVIPFKAKPKPAVTLKSTVRNDGLPKGIVTPSEKKVRQEKRKIKYVPEGWIYAAKDWMKQREEDYHKLGKTNDLERRLKEFNTAGDFEMMHWVKVPDVKKAEDMLHYHFRDQHHLREWFKVSLEDAIEAMDAIGDIVNDPDWKGEVDLGDADDA